MGTPILVARRHHLHWRILQDVVKAYLLQGASTEGSARLFNSSLDGKRTPRDDIHEERS